MRNLINNNSIIYFLKYKLLSNVKLQYLYITRFAQKLRVFYQFIFFSASFYIM